MDPKYRLWLFLFFLSSSCVNFLALGFFTVYADLGAALIREFARVWMFLVLGMTIFFLLGMTIFFLLGMKGVKNEEIPQLRAVCNFCIVTLKIFSILTFSIGLFKVTRFLVDGLNKPDLLNLLLQNRETALISLLLGAIFLRCEWKISPAYDSVGAVETFRFFLYSSTNEHDNQDAPPQLAAPIILVLLALLGVAPSFAYNGLLAIPSQQVSQRQERSLQYQTFARAFELEDRHSKWAYLPDSERTPEDIKGLVEALELYRDAESKAKILNLSGEEVGNCILGQARTLIRLGHYEQAWPLLEQHRTQFKKEWSQIGRVSSSNAPMPIKEFVLTYWKTGHPEPAYRFYQVARLNNSVTGRNGFDRLSLLLAIDLGYWGEAMQELKKARRSVGRTQELDALNKKVQRYDSDVDVYLNSLCHERVEF